MTWTIILTVIITLLSYNAVVLVVAQITNREDITITVAMGILYPIAYVLTYPIRAWNTYSHSRGYYEKHGITRFQYVFLFKRVHSSKRGQDDD